MMATMANFVEPRQQDPRFHIDRRYRMLIAGTSVEAECGEVITRESPAYDDVVVSTIPKGGRADAEAAILAAREAFDSGPWPRMSGADRARIMTRVADLLLEHRDELATIECLEVGKALTPARSEIGYSAELWAYAAGQARGLEGESHNGLGSGGLGLTLREPVGVVGVITPWNFPLLIASERVPWALGAGCTVVLKPSELTSGSSIRLAELARDAGLPDGVFNVVTGYGDPVGRTLAEHPGTDFLSFTGSLRVGQLVGGLAVSRIKRVGLELGGKGPQIVFADADLDEASDAVARSIFGVAGQACISGSRLIVERPAHDAILERLCDIAGRIRVGDPLDERTMVGSLIHGAHLEKVSRYVSEGQSDGAELVAGGERLGDSGSYYAPTIFARVRPTMSIAREEIFGPVLSVIAFDTQEEAVLLSNDTNYGLSASVWTSDITMALRTIRQVRAGRTWINGAGQGAPSMSISGFKQSGIGRELGRQGFDEYSHTKSVYVALERRTRWIN